MIVQAWGYARTPLRNFYLIDRDWWVVNGLLQGTMVPDWPTDGVYPQPRLTTVAGTWVLEEFPEPRAIPTVSYDTQGGRI